MKALGIFVVLLREKNSEHGIFLRFYAYICHANDDFACFALQL